MSQIPSSQQQAPQETLAAPAPVAQTIDRKLSDTGGSYPREAFNFVQEGLGFTVHQVHGDLSKVPQGQRHVGGRQLCLGLRDYAIERYGLLARQVLEHWRIHRTDDFGRIVFQMIEQGHMCRSDDDRPEDFQAIFSFDEAFAPERVLQAVALQD